MRKAISYNPALYATPLRAEQRYESAGRKAKRDAVVLDAQGAWIATTGDIQTARAIAATLSVKTASRVYRHAHAQVIALALIEASQWFAVTPLPFDKYRIEVKQENASMLKPAAAFTRVATKV